MKELSKDQLWYPGQEYSLTAEYPVPDTDELINLWRDYTGSDAVIAAPGVYGVLLEPPTEPAAFASIDLCEVVRHTHTGLRLAEEPIAGELSDIHEYCSGLKIGNNHDITSVAQVLIGAGLIRPVDQIDDITSMIQHWRQESVYVFANTSTLPGCEAGTIEFMRQHMPEAFDGLLLPRNYDSSLPLTKGVAAASVIGKLSTAASISAVHIDDKPAHNAAFWNELSRLDYMRIATFQPYYPSSYPADPDSTVTTDPVAAFRAADDFLLRSSA